MGPTPPLESVADSIEDYAGPLAGLHAGIEWARRETPEAKYIASVPIDSPFLPLLAERTSNRTVGDAA